MKVMKKHKQTRLLSFLLLIIGCLQMAGYVFKIPALRGLGFSYGASPLPTVFGTVKGVEGFSTRHAIIYSNENGAVCSIRLDKKLFNQFNGSYLLKNAYSLFLAYPHVLKKSQVEHGVAYLLSKDNLKTRFSIEDSVIKPKLYSESGLSR